MPQFLKQADAAFLRMEGARTPMHVGCLLTFKMPSFPPADFLPRLMDALRNQQLAPPFNCHLASPGRARWAPAWEEAREIELDYHVRHSALPRPGGERELGVLIGRLHSNPLDLNRPLWELHLIEGLENKRFAVYAKVHRACLGGAAGMRMLQGWLTEDAEDTDLQRPFFGAAPREEAAAAETPGARLLRVAGEQWAGARELFGALRDLQDARPEGASYPALRTPRTPFNTAVTAQRRLATQVYELERFEAIEAATGAGVDDIALAAVGGAMRRYLKEYNALPERTMVASLPRGNAFTGFAVPLATDQHDPLQRLERIRAVTEATRQVTDALSPVALEQFATLGFLPMMLGQFGGLNARLPPLCNITVSSVAGPRQPMYLAGARLESMFPVSLLLDGYALNLTLLSYAERLCLGFVGCHNALPHLQRLAVYTGLALDELETAVKHEHQ